MSFFSFKSFAGFTLKIISFAHCSLVSISNMFKSFSQCKPDRFALIQTTIFNIDHNIKYNT